MEKENALQKILEKRLRKQLKKFLNFQGKEILKDDPGVIHKFRINVRKIRSLLEEFVNEIRIDISLIDEFRKVFRKAGKVRDYDVLIADVRSYLEKDGDEAYRDFLQSWIKKLEKKREKKYNDFIDYIVSGKYENIIKQVKELRDNLEFKNFYYSDSTHNSIVNLILSKLYRLYAHNYLYVDYYDILEIHHFRRQVKRTRYYLEFFKKFYKQSRYKEILDSLKQMQEISGRIVDIYVLKASLEKFYSEFDPKEKMKSAFEKLHTLMEVEEKQLLSNLMEEKNKFLQRQKEFHTIIENECNTEILYARNI